MDGRDRVQGSVACFGLTAWLVTTLGITVGRALHVVRCHASAVYCAIRTVQPSCTVQLSPCAHRAPCRTIYGAPHLRSLSSIFVQNRSASFTSVHVRPPSFTFIRFRSQVFIFIHLCKLSLQPLTVVHIRSLSFASGHIDSQSFTFL